MKLWEKPLAIIYRLMAGPYLEPFVLKRPEALLKRSLHMLDAPTVERIRAYVKSAQTPSGGFSDKAGKPDLYYSLFGFFLAEALDMTALYPDLQAYLESVNKQKEPEGVYLYCSAVLHAKLGTDKALQRQLRRKVHQNLPDPLKKQPVYGAFLSLLACYYLQDYRGLYLIRKRIRAFEKEMSLPCSVLAAFLVLQHSLKKPVHVLTGEIIAFYDGKGGFKATLTTPVPDLLSTAVALYALHYAGADLRTIKPDCLVFVDSLYHEGGFAANWLDADTDIEYTFYGLLALGALAGNHE